MKFRELMAKNLSDVEKACSKHGLQLDLPQTKQLDLEKLLCLEAEIFTHPFSLIHYAAAVRDKNALAYCLERGDDPNKQDQHGFTAAHYAAAYGFASMIEILVNKGANLRSHDDVTVWDCASSSKFNRENTCYYLEKIGIGSTDFLSSPDMNAHIRSNILRWLDLVDLQNVACVSKGYRPYVKTFFRSHIKTVRFPKEVLSETTDQAKLLDRGLQLAVNRKYHAMTAAYLRSGANFIIPNSSHPSSILANLILNKAVKDGHKGVAKALYHGLFEQISIESHAFYLLVQGTDAEITRYMASQPNKWPDCLLYMWEGDAHHIRKKNHQERHHYLWDNLLTDNHKKMVVFFAILRMLGEKERSNLESRKMSFFSRQWKIKYNRYGNAGVKIKLGQKLNEDEFVVKIPAMMSSINQLPESIRKNIIVNSIGDQNFRVFRPILEMMSCDNITFNPEDIYNTPNYYLHTNEVFSNIEFVTFNYPSLISNDTSSNIVKLMSGDNSNDQAVVDDIKDRLKEAEFSKNLLIFLLRYFNYKGFDDLTLFLIDEYKDEYPQLIENYNLVYSIPSYALS